MRRTVNILGISTTVAATAMALAVLGPTTGAEVAQAASAPAAAPGGSQKVIVVLANQLAGTPADKQDMGARRAQAVATQNAVIAGLTGATPSHLKHFALGNAFAATVSDAQAAQLAADPRVASVVPDRTVELPEPTTSTASSAASTSPTPAAVDANGPDAICPSDPAHPLVEPEALRSIRAYTTDGSPYAQQLATGNGVRVAFIADSMDPNNPDFIRPNGEHVFFDYQDFSGAGPSAPSDGREAFGDASSIAAQGTVVHDLANFVNQAHPLPPGCNIVVRGVAPGASLAGLVFGSNSSILQAIDYAVSTDHVDVLNESFGLNAYPDFSMRNALTLFNDAAVDAGVTVTVSSGDAGITNTIGSPPDPKVIQVAGTTDNRLYMQTTYAAAPFSNGKWVSDNISALSSSGLSQYARTVDLAAPGEGNWAVCQGNYSGCRNFQSPPQPTDLQSFGGTSESAPLTAGVAALVIQAYRGSHGGKSPSPKLVKQLITGTAHDLGLPADEQGAGLLDARAAVEAAMSYRVKGGDGTKTPGVGSNLITSESQFTLTGKPGEQKHEDIRVTNAGTTRLTVHAGARDYENIGSSNQTVPFDSQTLPTFTYYNGATWAYKKVQFTVPEGGDRLLTRMAFQQAGSTDIVRLTLLDPSGRLMANSRPQGATPNYANVDVRDPAPGTWTAVLYSPAGAPGYHSAPVLMQFDTQRATSVGSLQPASFALQPGESRYVRATFTLPATSGGTDYAVAFTSSAGQQTAVSAVLDTLIDTAHGGAYSGQITGGNARGVSPGETFSYGFDVPRGRRDLDVSLRLASDPNDIVDVVLIDPNGELADVGSNVACDAGAICGTGLTAQLFDAHPIPGRWRLVVVVQNPVSGAEISQSFSGAVTFDGVETSASGLPNSPSQKLPAGQPVTATVLVHNTGVQSILVGTDPRLESQQTLGLSPIQGQTSFALPADPNDPPVYLVPPDTSSLTVTAHSTVPAQLEIQGSAAGFDVFGSLQAAKAGSLTSTVTIQEQQGEISKGIWFTSISEIGPFTDAGQASGSTTLTASMTGSAFDTSVSSSTDDPFQAPDLFGTPELIPPGGTGTIQVTFTPQGSKGSTVRGHLNLVTPPVLPVSAGGGLPFYTTGSTIATLPYSYKIK